MDDQTTESRVVKLVAEVLGRDQSGVVLDSRFVEDLEANSLDVVELVCLAEEEFGIKFPEARIAKIRTVGDVIHVINELRHI